MLASFFLFGQKWKKIHSTGDESCLIKAYSQ